MIGSNGSLLRNFGIHKRDGPRSRFWLSGGGGDDDDNDNDNNNYFVHNEAQRTVDPKYL